MKKIVFSFLILVLSFSFSFTSVRAASFSDVPSSHWAYKEVNYLTQNKIFNGVSKTTFGKDGLVTRGQAAAVLARAKGLKLEGRPNPNFKDVPTSHPFYKEIAAVVDAGWFQKAQSFHPDGKLTRAEMAKIISNAFKLSSTVPVQWEDLSSGYWGQPFVARLVASGITNGYSSTEYKPGMNMTRAQFAVFIARALNESFRPQMVVYPKKVDSTIFYPQVKARVESVDLSKLNQTLYEYALEGKKAKQELQEMAKEDPYLGPYYTYESSFKIGKADNKHISLVIFEYIYSGGAHGYESYSSFNYGVQTKSWLRMNDVATKSGYSSIIINYINNEAQKRLHSGKLTAWDGLYSLEEHMDQFYLTDKGLVMFFNPYEYGPYADSIREFLVPYSVIQ
ncbi:MAG TPA: S-layer homology domain-containing protein [Chondromyces sp.]|nr:S-layer homology domain-containing protein [Chondromyces sp.]